MEDRIKEFYHTKGWHYDKSFDELTFDQKLAIIDSTTFAMWNLEKAFGRLKVTTVNSLLKSRTTLKKGV